MGDDDVLNVSIMSKTIQLRPSDDNIGDKSFPLVFKCAKCSQIIGDSISWVCSNEDLRAITLMRVSDNVKRGTKLKMSTEGFDMGSAYLPLFCGSCSVDLGRLYRTTPRHLDEIREMFTIDVDRIESYQVGSCQQQAASAILAENIITLMELKSCLDEHKKRIGALEEMLRNVNCTASPDTETVTQDIAKYVNETPEFRVPHPVPSSEECDLSQQSSARYSGRNESLSKSLPSIDSSCVLHDKVTAIAACKTVSSGCQTAGNPKRRKFNGD